MRKRILLATPTMHGEEQEFVKRAFETNWIAPLGENVDRFEKELASYVGVRSGAACSSGTSAIHLAVKLAGVKRGDIVFCSDMTFAATVNPIVYEGGVPVFIDSERDTWNMDPQALEIAFEKYPTCRCVVVVNLYGVPAKLDEISNICDRHGAILIEDAAESLSATYKGIQTGSFGRYNAISFNGNKIITSSGGGMLISNDEKGINKARFWSTQSRDQAPWYQHSEIGYNYRMSNIVAGIGRGQLLHLDEHRILKKNIYERYKVGLEGLPIMMNPFLDCSEPNFWLSCIYIDNSETSVKVMDIYNKLNDMNIESRPIWKPMHMQPLFEENDYICVGENSVDEDIFAHGLCLPSDIKMTVEEQNYVIKTIRECFKISNTFIVVGSKNKEVV